MSRRLLGVNLLLWIASLLLAGSIARQLTLPPPLTASRPAAPAPAAAPPAPRSASSPQAYSSVVARNLFNPSRSETTAPPEAPAAVAARKPTLQGIVLTESQRIAYLEDPATRRVSSYQAGDSIGGGSVETIAWDRVVIVGPEGKMEVLLHDPNKPRAPLPAAAPTPGSPRSTPARGPAPPIPRRPPPPPAPDATAR